MLISTTDIATSFGLSENELFRQALISLMQEKKRQVLQLKLEILARYGATSVDGLESHIAEGTVVEHPAWEDLIVSENLDARIEEIDGYLRDLQETESHRSE